MKKPDLPPTPPIRDWDAVWAFVWKATFNVLGLLLLVGSVGAIAYSLLTDEPRSSTATSLSTTRQAQRVLFISQIDKAAKPCAVKTKSVSDVTGCSVLGLRLGMSMEDVQTIMDGSGLFDRASSYKKGCSSKRPSCDGYLYYSNDSISAAVEFEKASTGESLKSSNVAVWFSRDGNPYTEIKDLAAVFTKRIGKPDGVSGAINMWGGSGGPEIRAFEHEDRYAIIISASDTDTVSTAQ